MRRRKYTHIRSEDTRAWDRLSSKRKAHTHTLARNAFGLIFIVFDSHDTRSDKTKKKTKSTAPRGNEADDDDDGKWRARKKKFRFHWAFSISCTGFPSNRYPVALPSFRLTSCARMQSVASNEEDERKNKLAICDWQMAQVCRCK